MGGSYSKDAVTGQTVVPEPDKKAKKRDRSKTTPSPSEETPAVSSNKHSLVSTLPRGWKPSKNGAETEPQASINKRKASTAPVGMDSREMNGYSTLQLKKEKKPKVEPTGMTITGPDGIPHRVYVTVRRNNATRPKFRKSESCSAAEENASSAQRPKMIKSHSTASSSSSGSGKRSLPRQGSLSPASPKGGTPSIKDLSCLKYTDSATAERHAVHIIDEVASQWRRIGSALNCEEHDLDNIASNNKDVQDCCRVMFTQWCKGRIGDEPQTWARLIEALQDARCGKISKELKHILSEQGVWEYSNEKSCSIM